MSLRCDTGFTVDADHLPPNSSHKQSTVHYSVFRRIVTSQYKLNVYDSSIIVVNGFLDNERHLEQRSPIRQIQREVTRRKIPVGRCLTARSSKINISGYSSNDNATLVSLSNTLRKASAEGFIVSEDRLDNRDPRQFQRRLSVPPGSTAPSGILLHQGREIRGEISTWTEHNGLARW